MSSQGKFVRIFFNSIGAIAGANIDWYLLEKSRVTARSEHERSFHVFFQLLRGADAAMKSEFARRAFCFRREADAELVVC
jgi:myosin protein heavy chain